jgi:hypothetical protein
MRTEENQPRPAEDPARLLRSLAREIRPMDNSAATRMADLSGALEGHGRREDWSNVDIFRLINPDGILARFRAASLDGGRWLGILEWFRNVLLFAPLILTFTGLWLAMRGYSAIADDPRYRSDTFVYLWQHGFFGHSPLRLSDLAMLDVSLLLTLALITAVIHLRVNVAQAVREHRSYRLASRLDHALAGAALDLSQRRWNGAGPLVDRVETLVGLLSGSLAEERERLESLGAQLADLVAGQRTATAAVQEASVGIAVMAEAHQAATSRLETVAGAIADLPAALGRAAGGLGTATGELRAAVEALEGTRGHLAATQQETERMLQRGRDDMIRLLQRAFHATRSAENAMRAVQDLVPVLKTAATDMRFASAGLRDLAPSVHRLAGAAEHHDAAAQHLAAAADRFGGLASVTGASPGPATRPTAKNGSGHGNGRFADDQREQS